MAKDLDEHVEQFRSRRLGGTGPFTLVAADALVLKIREGGRAVGMHALVATGANADGHREILGHPGHVGRGRRRPAGLLPRSDPPFCRVSRASLRPAVSMRRSAIAGETCERPV